jgi:hypothetical protein
MQSFRILTEAAARVSSTYLIDESRSRIAHAKATHQAAGDTIIKTLYCIEQSLKRLQKCENHTLSETYTQRLHA